MAIKQLCFNAIKKQHSEEIRIQAVVEALRLEGYDNFEDTTIPTLF